MQQYFLNRDLNEGQRISLTDDILHHLKDVLRKKDGYQFRIVDLNNQVYLCELKANDAVVLEKLSEQRELDINVTMVISLIKNDKFELILQKLCELGVKRIVPYMANRSIIRIQDQNHKLRRFNKIIEEASEQCNRSYVPYIDRIIGIDELKDYIGQYNYVAYEKNDGNYIDYHKLDGDTTIIIGPEGGFEEKEIKAFRELGFNSISLGKRILRAETAAIFVMSNIVGAIEK